jgi:superfamily II DNA or RNA helicase/HKD family nuclease
MSSPPLRPGLYDAVIDAALRRRIDALDPDLLADEDHLENAEAPDRLSRIFGQILRGALEATPDLTARAHLIAGLREIIRNAQADLLDDGQLSLPGAGSPLSRLLEVRARYGGLGVTQPTRRPTTPLADSTLLINAPGEPAMAQELQAELASADRADLLIAFVKWSGIRLVEEPIRELIARGGRIRVLTTTYTGASELHALSALARWGADVRISFDNRRTRLHAKAWIFHRDSGASTAYIGSSNLSSAAMLDGLEWNVRLAALESPTLLEKFAASYEAHWASEEFVHFDPEDAKQVMVVREALESAKGGAYTGTPLSFFDLRPHGYQQTMLDALSFEREHGHHRNLVVAPTGVGKTMVAAFDYARIPGSEGHHRPRLLFVAHRERLLDQSMATFRQVLRDGSFGEKMVAGHMPSVGDHVFASIQSLNSQGRIDALDPDHYDVVIVDEFHHAEAPTYERLLQRVRPRILLGLTATPERHDGKDIRRWFDGRTAYEMRLWHALERGLLAPFHYFGIHDTVDLSHIRFTRGRYDDAELSGLYTGNHARAALIVREVERTVGDAGSMRALGFCVSVEHARFMAGRFTEAGIPSVAVTGDSTSVEREDAIRRLEARSVNVLFTVDLFNEGVDIPKVDTVLFLRPTESATVFLQQLGRGLRLHEGKGCLTVLDFIGNAHAGFRFDLRYRALLGGTTKQVREQITEGFPFLPPGCAMRLDRVSREIVLENLRSAVGQGVRWLSAELRALGPDASLAHFLDATGIEPVELYDGGRRSFTSLKHDAFQGRSLSAPRRKHLARLAALLHVEDDDRIAAIRAALQGRAATSLRALRLRHMVASAFFDRSPVEKWEGDFAALLTDESFAAELAELVDVLDERRREPTHLWRDEAEVPLNVHARYRREEILTALGITRNGKVPRVQAGVFYDEATNADLLFVTLRKTERGFSPKTMYRDHAVSRKVFHWETQHTAHADTATGRRYLAGSSKVLLFVREQRKLANGLAEPFVFLGPCRLESYRGARPMQIEWELEREMPSWLFEQAAVMGR